MATSKKRIVARPGHKVIFVTHYFNKKLGKVIYARQYGIRAFPLEVPV
jgi:hypothetical protein